MRGAMPPLLNTSSWRGAYLSTGATLSLLYVYLWALFVFITAKLGFGPNFPPIQWANNSFLAVKAGGVWNSSFTYI
jgi:hypothetical protein